MPKPCPVGCACCPRSSTPYAVPVPSPPADPPGDDEPGPPVLRGAVPSAAVAALEDAHTHIREPVREVDVLPAEPPDVEPVDAPPVMALPRPGRHAARRGERWSPGTLLAGRAALGPAQVAVVAVLVAVGLALTAWWVVRDDGEAIPVEPMAAPGLASPGPSVPAPPASASPSSEVVVDVAGKVRRPGIVVLDPGARVVDALEAAGGARPGVDLAGLNLARLLVDGEQIVVGVPAPPGPAASAAGTPGRRPGGAGQPEHRRQRRARGAAGGRPGDGAGDRRLAGRERRVPERRPAPRRRRDRREDPRGPRPAGHGLRDVGGGDVRPAGRGPPGPGPRPADAGGRCGRLGRWAGGGAAPHRRCLPARRGRGRRVAARLVGAATRDRRASSEP